MGNAESVPHRPRKPYPNQQYQQRQQPYQMQQNQYNNLEFKTIITELKKDLVELRVQYGDAQKDGAEMRKVIQENW